MIKLIGKSGNFFPRHPYPKNLFDFRKFGKTRFSEKASKFDFFSSFLFVLEEHLKKRIIVDFDAIW